MVTVINITSGIVHLITSKNESFRASEGGLSGLGKGMLDKLGRSGRLVFFVI